jgi:hypothetical protein
LLIYHQGKSSGYFAIYAINFRTEETVCNGVDGKNFRTTSGELKELASSEKVRIDKGTKGCFFAFDLASLIGS